MSNRLRASMRAGNKGRSLRPRTSSRNSTIPPESDLTTSDLQADAIARDAEANAASEAPQSVRPAAPPPDEVVAAAKITPAEVLAARKAFSSQREDEDDEQEKAPSTKAAVPTALKAVEAPVVAKVEEPVAARKAS